MANIKRTAIINTSYEMAERRARVKKACDKWRAMGFDKQNLEERYKTWMKVDEALRLAACLVPKVTTSILSNKNVLLQCFPLSLVWYHYHIETSLGAE